MSQPLICRCERPPTNLAARPAYADIEVKLALAKGTVPRSRRLTYRLLTQRGYTQANACHQHASLPPQRTAWQLRVLCMLWLHHKRPARPIRCLIVWLKKILTACAGYTPCVPAKTTTDALPATAAIPFSGTQISGAASSASRQRRQSPA